MNLRHRHGLPLTRPAISFPGGTKTGREMVAEIEPTCKSVNRLCVITLYMPLF